MTELKPGTLVMHNNLLHHIEEKHGNLWIVVGNRTNSRYISIMSSPRGWYLQHSRATSSSRTRRNYHYSSRSRPMNKPKRFVPLDVKKDSHTNGDVWRVRYYNKHWHINSIDVVASDEITAFAVGSAILRQKWWKEMLDTVPAFAVVSGLAGLGLITLAFLLLDAALG